MVRHLGNTRIDAEPYASENGKNDSRCDGSNGRQLSTHTADSTTTTEHNTHTHTHTQQAIITCIGYVHMNTESHAKNSWAQKDLEGSETSEVCVDKERQTSGFKAAD